MRKWETSQRKQTDYIYILFVSTIDEYNIYSED